ncbi:Zinc finger protein [Trichinella patagoniensis]|uniref:Zinc finger protein n=1 Tax=Trichinella patagoniensis TaxID=990121 RepID=A0A0V1A6Y0_9BILA|nr:Zinc finger protein [Trichinella patagoniensis]
MHCMSERVFENDAKILSLNKQQISINHRSETNKISPKSNVVPLTKSQMSSRMNHKKIACEYCGKHFSRGTGYQDHINMHRNIRPYVCEICGKSFNNSGAKSNHMRIHDRDRHFRCTLCEREFPWKISLKIHLKSHQRMGELTDRIENYLETGNPPRKIRRTCDKAQNSSVTRHEFTKQKRARRHDEMCFYKEEYEERILPSELALYENKKWYEEIGYLDYMSGIGTLDSSYTTNEEWAKSTGNKTEKKMNLGSVIAGAMKCCYEIPSAEKCYEPKLNIQHLGIKNNFTGEKWSPMVIKKKTNPMYFYGNGVRSSGGTSQ